MFLKLKKCNFVINCFNNVDKLKQLQKIQLHKNGEFYNDRKPTKLVLIFLI